MVKVEVYYADMCGLCHKAMDYFTAKGVPFEAYRLEWDTGAGEFKDSEHTRELYERCGKRIDFVPQCFINDRWISGWRELEPMIDSGEIDQFLV
jgi:glutaredoxin